MRVDNKLKREELDNLNALNAFKQREINRIWEIEKDWQKRLENAAISDPVIAQQIEAKINNCRMHRLKLAEDIDTNKKQIKKIESAIHENQQSRFL